MKHSWSTEVYLEYTIVNNVLNDFVFMQRESSNQTCLGGILQ